MCVTVSVIVTVNLSVAIIVFDAVNLTIAINLLYAVNLSVAITILEAVNLTITMNFIDAVYLTVRALVLNRNGIAVILFHSYCASTYCREPYSGSNSYSFNKTSSCSNSCSFSESSNVPALFVQILRISQ